MFIEGSSVHDESGFQFTFTTPLEPYLPLYG